MFGFGCTPAWAKELSKGQQKIMAGIADIIAQEATEKKDIAALAALVTQLLAAFASGQITPAQAQQLLADMQSDDATVQGSVASIVAALPPTT